MGFFEGKFKDFSGIHFLSTVPVALLTTFPSSSSFFSLPSICKLLVSAAYSLFHATQIYGRPAQKPKNSTFSFPGKNHEEEDTTVLNQVTNSTALLTCTSCSILSFWEWAACWAAHVEHICDFEHASSAHKSIKSTLPTFLCFTHPHRLHCSITTTRGKKWFFLLWNKSFAVPE